MNATSATDTGLPAYDAQDDLITLQALVQGVEVLFGEVSHETSPASNALGALFTVLQDQFEAAIQRSNNNARMQRARS